MPCEKRVGVGWCAGVALGLLGVTVGGCSSDGSRLPRPAAAPAATPAAPVTDAATATAQPASSATPPVASATASTAIDAPPAPPAPGPSTEPASLPPQQASAPPPTKNSEDQPPSDPAKARRFEQLKARAWRIVKRDPEHKAHCQRLEALKAKHSNLQGCISWLEEYPDDLCTDPAPPPRSDPTFALQELLSHKCFWRFYVGERMDTHTNRHFTLVVDVGRGRVVGAQLPSGIAIPGDVWSRAPALRRALRNQLAKQAGIRKACKGAAVCPTVGSLWGSCASPRCFGVTLQNDEVWWAIQTDARGNPDRVFDDQHADGRAFSAWLSALAAGSR